MTMPRATHDDAEIRVDPVSLASLVEELFTAAGCRRSDARLLSTTIVGADLRGVPSHGCMLVPHYIDRLLTGQISPKGRPRIVSQSPAAIVVDAHNAMGHVAVAYAMERALEKAALTGATVFVVRNSNHCGALASYAAMALARDMLGIVATHSVPTMAWWGGTDRIVGLNPIAVAIPAGKHPPIVLDTTFGAAARGKIVIHGKKRIPIPEHWATDREGRPTTDPAVALRGLIQPIGGHKGAALALVVGVLTAVLSGSAYGTELGDVETGVNPGRDSQFGLAIAIEKFTSVSSFKRRIDRIIDEIHSSTPAPGFTRLVVPGELAAERELEARARGVPLASSVAEALQSLALRLGVSATLHNLSSPQPDRSEP